MSDEEPADHGEYIAALNADVRALAALSGIEHLIDPDTGRITVRMIPAGEG